MLAGRFKGAQAIPKPSFPTPSLMPVTVLRARKIAVRCKSPARGNTRWACGCIQPVGGGGGIGSPAALTSSMLRMIRMTHTSPTELKAATSESEASASDELNA